MSSCRHPDIISINADVGAAWCPICGAMRQRRESAWALPDRRLADDPSREDQDIDELIAMSERTLSFTPAECSLFKRVAVRHAGALMAAEEIPLSKRTAAPQLKRVATWLRSIRKAFTEPDDQRFNDEMITETQVLLR